MTESFNDWGGRGCRKFIPVLGDGTKIAPPGDIIDQPSSGMSWIRGKFADHVGDHVVLFPEGTVSVTSPGTKSSCPRPLQSLNDSTACYFAHDFLVSIHFVLPVGALSDDATRYVRVGTLAWSCFRF